jgi:hypothetical protein
LLRVLFGQLLKHRHFAHDPALSAIACSRQLSATQSSSNIGGVKFTLRSWMIWASAVGLLLPVLFIVRWQVSGSGFGLLEATLWPASIMFMGLEGNPNTSNTLIVFAIAVAANGVLYAGIGLLIWPALRLVLRRH